MKTLIMRWTTLAYALAMPAIAFAQEHADEHGAHGEHGWDTTALVASFVNFVVLIAVFVYLFKDSLKSYLVSRKAEVEKELLEAARLKADAEAKHKEYSERLAKLDSELAKMKTDMQEAGKREFDRIIADAEHKAARMRKEAEFLIEQQAKTLRNDITRESTDGAVAAAAELLLRATTTYDQQRLAQEYLGSLGGNGPTKTSIAPQPESQV
ncbi:MAG TPA: ATP synthase F0 subunit B [Polyangiales bacterium]|nr:ATP synthase F0 subunit B [Polyangiales bacterium]